MPYLSQEQLLLIVRALSHYLEDCLKEEDFATAAKVGKMIHEASHCLESKR